MSLQKLITTVKLCTACIFTVNFSAPAAKQRSQVKWLSPVKPEKNDCPASALFECSLIRFDVFRLRNDLYCVEWGVKLYSLAVAADHKASPPPPMKNTRRAAAAGHKTTQRRRRPPVRRRTALITLSKNCRQTSKKDSPAEHEKAFD